MVRRSEPMLASGGRRALEQSVDEDEREGGPFISGQRGLQFPDRRLDSRRRDGIALGQFERPRQLVLLIDQLIGGSPEQLASKKCRPCEGGVDRLTVDQAREQLGILAGWRLTDDGQRIRKDWETKDFRAGMDFLNRVAALAEQEGHHPDMHLEGYRHLWIAIWTHAIGGLSENDFILAAKIDRLPVEVKCQPGPLTP